MIDHVVVDVEIQKQIGQDGLGWDDTDKLGVACAVVYEYKNDRFRVYGHTAEELEALRRRLTEADRVSGYNIWKFDFPVIWGLAGRLRAEHIKAKTNDLLRRIWQGLGHDPDVFNKSTHGNWGLDVVAKGTLKAPGKIANGAQAPIWYQQGKYGPLINYCVDDVTLERDLTDFVDRYGYVVHGQTGQVVRL